MNIEELNKRKIPIVKQNKTLNKHNNTVLFPDKLKKANKTLGMIGLPESAKKPHS